MKAANKYKSFLIIFSMFFIVHCTLKIEDCFSQWFLQPWPVSGNTYDIKFFDANTGIASLENPAIIRTTNGGQNWQIINYIRIYSFQKISDSVMYGQGRSLYAGSDLIYRTFNKGLTWDSVAIFGYGYRGISFINSDTGYISGGNGNNYIIWKTTNGGITLSSLTNTVGKGVIFFLKYKINGEYYGWCCHDIWMYKTTNSGNNWFQVGNTNHLIWQLEFINENTGFATNGGDSILQSTNGGLNWIPHTLPLGNNIADNNIKNFKIIDSNIIFGDRGVRLFINGNNYWFRGIIWKTTNGGLNWGFQQPDTSYAYAPYLGIDFIDSLNGWSYNIHTTNGGGPIIYVGIANNENEIPNSYVLQQNYPNPFNPSTTIEFSLPKESYVKLKIIDITGKTVFWIINDFLLNAGNHKYTIDAFNTLGLSSGIYFYRLEASDKNKQNEDFVETKKMVYLK